MTRPRVTVLASSTVLLLAACGGTTISRDSNSGGKGGKSQGAGGVAEGNGGGAGETGGASAAGASGRGGRAGMGGASAGGRGAGGAPGTGGRTGAGGSAAAGRSGTGGTAGTGGAGPVDAGGIDGSQPDAGCEALGSASPLLWGPNGGLVAYVEQSSLTAPRRYQHTRDYQTNGPQPTCTTEVDCPAALIAKINAALESSVVKSALAAHTLYGDDPRPVDGQVFHVTVGSGYLDVGTLCSSMSCIPAPPAVQALVDSLQALDAQELIKDACTTAFSWR